MFPVELHHRSQLDVGLHGDHDSQHLVAGTSLRMGETPSDHPWHPHVVADVDVIDVIVVDVVMVVVDNVEVFRMQMTVLPQKIMIQTNLHH